MKKLFFILILITTTFSFSDEQKNVENISTKTPIKDPATLNNEENNNKTFQQWLDEIDKNVRLTKSSTIIVQACADVWTEVQPILSPTEEQQLRQEYTQQKIDMLKAEEKLKQCLVEHAFDTKELQLPCSCNSFVNHYLSVAGVENTNKIRSEFITTLQQLAEPTKEKSTYSTTTKVLIGTGAVVAIAGGGAALIPIVLPGTVAAAKITAAIAYIKATAGVVATKIAATTTTTTSTATVVGTYTAYEGYEALKKKIKQYLKESNDAINKLTIAEKIELTAQIIEKGQSATAKVAPYALPIVKTVRPLIYETSEEELYRLCLKRESLAQMMFKKYGKKENGKSK